MWLLKHLAKVMMAMVFIQLDTKEMMYIDYRYLSRVWVYPKGSWCQWIGKINQRTQSLKWTNCSYSTITTIQYPSIKGNNMQQSSLHLLHPHHSSSQMLFNQRALGTTSCRLLRWDQATGASTNGDQIVDLERDDGNPPSKAASLTIFCIFIWIRILKNM